MFKRPNPEPIPETPPLTPEARERPGARGGSALLSDGQWWRLADYIPQLSPVWDELFNSNAAFGTYEPEHIRTAAVHLLTANYDVAFSEAFELLAGADPHGLMQAVEVAMFGAKGASINYSDWVEISLMAAGLNPATIPPVRLRDVLRSLVMAGRIAPANKMMSTYRAKEADQDVEVIQESPLNR